MLAAPRGFRCRSDRSELVERAPRTHGDARKGLLGELDREPRLSPKSLRKTVQEHAAPREHDAALADVRRELRRRSLERFPHGLDDLANRRFERLVHFVRGDRGGSQLRRNGGRVL